MIFHLVRPKPVLSASEASFSLKILYFVTEGIIRIYNEFEERIDNSVPRVSAWHCVAPLCDANQRPEE